MTRYPGLRDLYCALAGLGFVVVVFAIWAIPTLYQNYRHLRVDKRMQSEILRLSEFRPAKLTDDQWAYCILWTWNLHSNYGFSDISTSDLLRLTDEFQRKVDSGPDLATIDWLWDEYLKAVPRAKNYDHFRPTSEANRADFLSGFHGGNPLSQWHSEYLRRLDRK